MSATTQGVGMTDDVSDSVGAVARPETDPVSGQVARFDAAAGDDWSSVLAVAVLLVVLTLGALLLGGG
jgi:hypothetical protein